MVLSGTGFLRDYALRYGIEKNVARRVMKQGKPQDQTKCDLPIAGSEVPVQVQTPSPLLPGARAHALPVKSTRFETEPAPGVKIP